MKQLPFLTKIILVALFLCLNITAQTSETQKTQTAEEKQKEIEVRKFLASFIKEMDEKKDINKISETFFASDFKTRFTWFQEISPDLFKQMNDDEQFQSSSEMFNAMYQGLMCMYGNGYNFESFSDDKTDAIMKKILPPNIIELLKTNTFLNAMILDFENPDKELENITQLRKLISDLHKINEAFQTHIDAQSPKWHETYQAKSVETRSKSDYYDAEKCDKDNCKGLPPNTMIYHHDSFPFCVEIVEDAGSYKILNIYLRID